MIYSDKSTLVLMVQNSNNIFCYFNVSAITVKEFEDRHGEDSWKNSKPALKIYRVVSGAPEPIKLILIDPFADNWYIRMEQDACDVFVKYGRVLPDDTFVPLVVSNTVTTPRSYQSSDTTVYFVDVRHSKINTEESRLQTFNENKEGSERHIDIKPYPFTRHAAESEMQQEKVEALDELTTDSIGKV